MRRRLGARLGSAGAKCRGCGCTRSIASSAARQPVVQMAAKDRQPWWPGSLVSLCTLGVDVDAALEATAVHVRATLLIPEEWQPAEMIIDANRLRGTAADQLTAARDLAPSLPPAKDSAAGDGEAAAEGVRTPLASRVASAVSHIEGVLLEREGEARLLLLGALAGQHVLLLGPPGVGKSELGSRLAETLDTGSFTRQLSRFSTPEELFGPLSLAALQNDQYVRQTEGYLPEAGIVFIDEIFKGNTALLNSLLGIMAERLFDHGSTRTSLDDLRCVVGASHHPPEDEESLAALYDRFLLRRHITPLSHTSRVALLADPVAPSSTSTPVATFSVDECKKLAQTAVETVRIPDEVAYVLAELPEFLRVVTGGGLIVSDRRLAAAADLLRVAAHIDGRSSVDRYDCLLLRHVLWDRPSTQLKMDQWFAEKLAGAQAAYLEQALVGVLREGFLSSSVQTDVGAEVKEAEDGGLDAKDCARLRARLRPIRAALGSMQGQGHFAADAAVLAGHSFLTHEDLGVLRWKRQRAWQKRKQNKAANHESSRLAELRQSVEQLEAFLRLPPPLHACTMLCVAPRLGKEVLSLLFAANYRPATTTASMGHTNGDDGAAAADSSFEIKRGMALLDVIGGHSFNQRLWSRMMNPVHSGGQSRLVSHHNTEAY